MRTTKTYLLSTLLLLAASGCISEDNAPCTSDQQDEQQKMVLRLKISPMEFATDNASRADLGDQDGYEGAAPIDFEKISTLRAIIIHGAGDNREVEDMRLVATNDDGTPADDSFEFEVKSGERKGIYLIANEDAFLPPENSGYATTRDYLDSFYKEAKITQAMIDRLENWRATITRETIAHSTLFNAAGPSRLPLTEKFYVYADQSEATMSTVDDGIDTFSTFVQVVNLFITRAAAKATFEFVCDPTADSPYAGSGSKVTGVRLNNLSPIEFVFPKDTQYSPSKYIGNSENGIIREADQRYITTFASPDPPAETSTITRTLDLSSSPIEIKHYAADDIPVTRPVYFPETIIQSATGRFTVQVQIDGGAWLEARPLTDNILSIGNHDAVARNTHLRIIISFGKNNITWEAIEAPYNSVTLDPVFGL